jgi:hypothetical protein
MTEACSFKNPKHLIIKLTKTKLFKMLRNNMKKGPRNSGIELRNYTIARVNKRNLVFLRQVFNTLINIIIGLTKRQKTRMH